MAKQKFSLKVLSFALAILLLVATFPVAALETGDSAKVSKSDLAKTSANGSADSSLSYTNTTANYSDYIYYDTVIYNKYKDACIAIEQGLRNMDEKIYVSQYNIPVEDSRKVFLAVKNRLPDLFYVENAYPYGYQNSSTISYYSPIYAITDKEQVIAITNKEQLAAMQEKFYAKVDGYLSKVDDSMTDFQKALILHDALVLDCNYDYSPSVYILAVKGYGQCIAYAWLYTYLLARVGIKSEVVTSTLMSHSWNKVCIDGEYYNVDVTWDDPTNDKLGHVSHTYFLLSDIEFSTGHIDGNGNWVKRYHYGGQSANKSESTKYDGFDILHEVDSKFCYADGVLYCADNKNDSDYEKCIIKYNENDDSAEIIKRVSAKWSAGGSSYWLGGFISLDEYDGVLYYNTDNTINCYNIKEGTFEEYQTDLDMQNKCFGLLIKDNLIYAAITENPNVTGTWEYVGECIIPQTQLTTQPSNRGDADGDGELTIADATLIQRYLAEFITFNEAQLVLADVDGDGRVTICDVTKIQRILAKLE